MAKTITPATQYDTHLHIFGSGATSYPWYGLVVDDSPGDYLADPATYDGWIVTIADTPDDDQGGGVATLDHAQILRAIKRAAFGTRAKVSDACTREARNFLFRRDDTDFDSDAADQIIQVAMFGKVIYG